MDAEGPCMTHMYVLKYHVRIEYSALPCHAGTPEDTDGAGSDGIRPSSSTLPQPSGTPPSMMKGRQPPPHPRQPWAGTSTPLNAFHQPSGAGVIVRQMGLIEDARIWSELAVQRATVPRFTPNRLVVRTRRRPAGSRRRSRGLAQVLALAVSAGA